MQNLWRDEDAKGLEGIDLLVYRSRLIGRDTRLVVFYSRLSPDQRSILFGGRVAYMETNPLVSAPRLHKCLSDIFPSMKDAHVTHSWMGFVAYTFDTLPHVGKQDGIHYAMGYCGSGVSLATYFGMAIAVGVLKLLPPLLSLRGSLVLDAPRAYTIGLPLVLVFFAVFGLRAAFTIPTELDARHPDRWVTDALFLPRTRQKFRVLYHLGLTDAVRAGSDGPGPYTFWDYQAGAWQKNDGIRIDHLLLSPQAADRLVSASIDKRPRGWAKPSDHVPVVVELDLEAVPARQAPSAALSGSLL